MLVTPRDLAVSRRPLSRGYREIRENWTCPGHSIGGAMQCRGRRSGGRAVQGGGSQGGYKLVP